LCRGFQWTFCRLATSGAAPARGTLNNLPPPRLFLFLGSFLCSSLPSFTFFFFFLFLFLFFFFFFLRIVGAFSPHRYGGSGGDWRPDPLLPIAPTGFSLPQSVLQGVWVRVHSAAGMAAGNYTMQVSVAAGTQALLSVPLAVEVWAVSMPTLAQSAIGTAWSGEWTQQYFEPYYPNGTWQAQPWSAHARGPKTRAAPP
jgi:hypothetical protein